MTFCFFDTRILNINTNKKTIYGIFLSHQHSHKKNYNRKCDFS